MRRVRERGGEKTDVYESKGSLFYERVHRNYASIWSKPPSWSTGAARVWLSVKHHNDVEETAKRVFNAVRDLV
jgi:thymidylate kinase